MRSTNSYECRSKILAAAASIAVALALAASGGPIGAEPAIAQTADTTGGAGWAHYGGDAGGRRYSEAARATPDNVDQLIRAWTYRTGEASTRPAHILRQAKWQATPVLHGGSLYLCTPFNNVIALDPATGRERWRHDPEIATEGVNPANRFNCRGVAVWRDAAAEPEVPCATRVFTGTTDSRLIALDARSGARCEGFGENGQLDLAPSVPLLWPGEVQITSAPVVAAGVVIVGSAQGDNQRVAAPSGMVRAFDARTGAPRWSFDPIPREALNARAQSWGEGWRDAGHANVWAPMSIDETRGLVFMPTSSASPDFFGGLRPGDNRYANSVVAIEATTGAVRWAYQIVHHDVWDYDLPAQPTLVTLDLEGAPRDVVIQATKQGLVFVLDRDTGEPVFPVEERPVPQAGAPGEALSPTQPFPTRVPSLVPTHLRADDAFGLTPFDQAACRRAIESARSEGLYTPPSEQGTILFPFTGGGVNWGGVAFDPERQILYANTSRIAHRITLFPSAEYESFRNRFEGRGDVGPQTGAPFGMVREPLLGSLVPLPCNPPPWGRLAAIDLRNGKILWESTLGTIEEYTHGFLALPWGSPSLGGPAVTRGGIVFIGAAMDRYLRAFDARTGRELWQGRLPATAQATPMTYEWNGEQYVVVFAGGYPDAGIVAPSDTLVAFRLPREGEAGPSLWSRTIDRPGGRSRAFFAIVVLVLVAGALAIRRRRMRAGQDFQLTEKP
ncbi:MAG: pyrroloquinoline quinone-dependent dehydrogenase [Rhodospirillaceae bacterium]|nr:pyrroloquinoline quinone-dependent dehydrogenase [Rhodospirillaceae bacterium]